MGLQIRLIYLLVISNVTFRFLTDYTNVLPRAFNLLDVGITIALSVTALFRQRRRLSDPTVQTFLSSITKRLIVFNLILLLGTVLNTHSIYFPAALAQCIMLNEPLLLFIALVAAPIDLQSI